MKKILLIVSIFAFMFVFVACTEDATTTETTVEATTEATTTENSAPVLTGVPEEFYIEKNSDLTLAAIGDISATDAQDGDLTDSIILDLGDLDLTAPGDYTITLSITDEGGLTASATVTVHVTGDLNPDQLAQIALDTIAIAYEEGVEKLDLPRFDTETGTWFTWQSTNTHVVASNGFIIKPHVGSEAVEVTLTCTAKNSGEFVTKDFVITVQPNEEVEVTSSTTLDFVSLSDEYTVDDSTGIELYFVDEGTIPYVDIETFINMVDGAILADELTFTPTGEDKLEISYTVEYLDDDEVTTITEEYTCLIDFTLNTVTMNNYDFMNNYQGGISSSIDLGFDYTSFDEQLGNEIVFDLGAYNFDLIIEEDEYLMPFHMANLLFLGETYYNALYNGDMIYGGDSYALMDGRDSEQVSLINTSSLNDETIQDDMKYATYNFLAFAFDNFYGLKDYNGVETYYDILDVKIEGYLDSADGDFYDDIFSFSYYHDELHTRHGFPGYYEAPYEMGLSINDLGTKSAAYYNAYWDMGDAVVEKWGSEDDIPEYTLLNSETIAVVHITGFDFDTPELFRATLEKLPATVTDVVVDVSYNGGGIGGAAWAVISCMTDGEFYVHYQNPLDGSRVTYGMTSTNEAYTYNFYVLTSAVSFSAANQFPAMAKEVGIPVLGQQSSGGTCSLTMIVTPDGSSITMSSNNAISTRIGNEVDGYSYELVEGGIPVDYFMGNVLSDSQLIEAVNEAKAD